MGQSGSILLISCYELGHQPLSLASPSAFLQRAGYKCELLDLAITGLDETKVARAKFVGISVPMHTALRLGVRAAQRIREINSSGHICFYGLYASLNAEFLLSQLADSVIGGEFEQPLVELVKAVSQVKQSRLDDFEIDGVSFRGKIGEPFLQRLAFVPPRYSDLPTLGNYAQLVHDGARRAAGYVEASRGCLHRCLHCPITPVYDGRFFVVPEAVVMDSIRDLVRSGATHITFGDPDFLNGPGHSLRMVRAMHEEFPDLTFDFTAKVEHLLKRTSLLSELAEAGCLFVISAFESISDVVLKNLNKGHTREDIQDVLTIFRNAGIALRPTWVPFTPWTTLEDYIDLLEFIYAEQLIESVDPVQYTIRLLVPPGSALLKHAELIRDLGTLDQASFSYRWAHRDGRMDVLQVRVGEMVEQMNQSNEEVFRTFQRIRELAYEARGESPAPLTFELLEGFQPPHLTETWFCCAEPTGLQLDFFHEPLRAQEDKLSAPPSLIQIQHSQNIPAERIMK